MLQPQKSGKNWKEKSRFCRNTHNNNELQISLIFGVFATNFAVGCKYASYERHFVKKIQHLFSFHTTGWKLKRSPPTWPSWGVLCLFLQKVYLLSEKVSSQQFCSFHAFCCQNSSLQWMNFNFIHFLVRVKPLLRVIYTESLN